MRIIHALALLALTGCSACSLAPNGAQIEALVTKAVEQGIKDRKDYNDDKAGALLEAPCDISLGAYFRIGNAVKQEGLQMLCSGVRPNEPVKSLPVAPEKPASPVPVS